jgi:hypothetical protein
VDESIARIEVGGSWNLDAFMAALRKYRQMYAFAYAVRVPELDPSIREGAVVDDEDEDEDEKAEFHTYPWQGGFSTINFFSAIQGQVPAQYRLRIRAIQIASPGFVELYAALPLAVKVAGWVGLSATSLLPLVKLIRSIASGIKEHQLSKINVQRQELALAKDKRKFVDDSIERLHGALGLDKSEIELLKKRARNKELAELRILMGMARRRRYFAEAQEREVLRILPPVAAPAPKPLPRGGVAPPPPPRAKVNLRRKKKPEE